MKRIIGNKNRPRISVFRSNRWISAQIIDDEAGKTLVSLSSKSIADKLKPVDKASLLGKNLAQIAKTKKIKKAVFDRNGYLYHGQVKALADGMREGGIEF